ncbi:MAG: hypothetical protein WBH31_11680 [Promethearchaeia archaeon]
MRFKLFRMKGFGRVKYMFLGESKKRQYIALFGNDNKIIDIGTFKKDSEDYFLVYGEDTKFYEGGKKTSYD